MYGRWSVSFLGRLSQDAEAALAEAGIVAAADDSPDDASTVWVRAASPTEAIDWVRDEVAAYGSFSDFKAARVLSPIRMTLLENAYDFLNESLRSTIRAESEPRAWKFAVFDVAQAIELLLKARLEAEHPVLVYQDVDSRRNTVSMRQAIERIQSAAKIQLTERERRSLRKAQDWRDRIVHHEFELSPYEVESVYVQLYEFLVRFHDEHTNFGLLHDNVEQELWEQEAEMFEFFRREFVTYRGEEMIKDWPTEIVRSQSEPTIEMYGQEWGRIRYGNEPGHDEVPARPCHDCGVTNGELHVLGCDWENCPRCFGQLLGCGCASDEGPADDALRTRDEVAEEVRSWMRL